VNAYAVKRIVSRANVEYDVAGRGVWITVTCLVAEGLVTVYGGGAVVTMVVVVVVLASDRC